MRLRKVYALAPAWRRVLGLRQILPEAKFRIHSLSRTPLLSASAHGSIVFVYAKLRRGAARASRSRRRPALALWLRREKAATKPGRAPAALRAPTGALPGLRIAP